jgi:Leucine-rich repeat (LRR) protein
LLEGEEQLRHLYLGQNQIKKIDHLVSLPNLQTLDLTANKLLEINNFWLPGSSIDKLRTLNLSKNQIRNIRNLDKLVHLENLDLSDNRIIDLTGLCKLQSLRMLNLSNNLIEFLDMPDLKCLVDLNLRKNKITLVNKLSG